MSKAQPRVRIERKRLFGIVALLLVLVISNLAAWAGSETQSAAPVTAGGAGKTDTPVYFAPYTRVILFSRSTGQWVLAAFEQTETGNEFWSNNQLYRVVSSDKAQVVLRVDARNLFEADRPYDQASRRPGTSNVVHVLDKDMRPAAHAALGTVQPGATIRFQGKAYVVKTDRSLADTGKVFSAATSTLQRIEITRSALQHIIDRHTASGTMNAGKSIFSAGEDVQALIKNAELLTPVLQARGNFQRVFDAGRIIGVDRTTGKQTSTYSVITTQSGKLVTAFPGMP